MKSRHAFLTGCGIVLVAIAISGALSARPSGKIYIKGTIMLSGRPFASAWLVLSQNGQEKRRFLTGDDGKYYIGGLSPGAYFVTVLDGATQRFGEQVQLLGDREFNIKI
jgi:hypothetical protein